MRTRSLLHALTPALLALALAGPSGCDLDPNSPPPTEAREGHGEVYAWASVESIGYDHAGGINPSVLVGAELLEVYDIDDLIAHVRVSYVDPETEEVVLEEFDVPLPQAEIIELGDELSIELGELSLATEPDAETLAITAELTDVTDTLPDLWWTAVQTVEVNTEWGIVPCVHIAQAAYTMASTNEISMVVDASYEDESGAVFTEQFVVPLSSTRVMDPGGAVVGVEPAALELAGEANPLTLEVQVSLMWE